MFSRYSRRRLRMVFNLCASPEHTDRRIFPASRTIYENKHLGNTITTSTMCLQYSLSFSKSRKSLRQRGTLPSPDQYAHTILPAVAAAYPAVPTCYLCPNLLFTLSFIFFFVHPASLLHSSPSAHIFVVYTLARGLWRLNGCFYFILFYFFRRRGVWCVYITYLLSVR